MKDKKTGQGCCNSPCSPHLHLFPFCTDAHYRAHLHSTTGELVAQEGGRQVTNYHYFKDPEKACLIMVRRGYSILQDRATGVLFRRADRFVHMQPDGFALALAENYGPCWCADRELAEVADRRAAR